MNTFNIEETLTPFDLEVLKKNNIDLKNIKEQFIKCSQGTISTVLDRVATINDGIFSCSTSEKEELIIFYDAKVANYEVEKFVPASGAATRMFKFLIDFLKKYNTDHETVNSYINKHKAHELETFSIGIEKFSFYSLIHDECLKTIPDFTNLSSDQKLYAFVKTMLESKKFNFSNKPKALIPFHKIDHKIVTPLTKHLDEAIKLCSHKPKIHFTVTKGFEADFAKTIADQGIACDVSFSNQMNKTNSVAFDLENNLFRSKNNKLLFRPGGHGALIENLNELSSDIIFIKNIDNVSFNHLDEIVKNKKLLGGILIKHQEIIFNILNKFSDVQTQENIVEILNYMEKQLNIFVPSTIKLNSTLDEIKTFIYQKLNRPIRVCGMVKNEGEPGGGPFWVKNDKGEITLQIVETSQIDTSNISQQLILSQSTHFNPVDLVCGVKNYLGSKFDLTQYIDENTGFVVRKSHEGRCLKAYELPGLWNGAMADWISIFVEVPINTFNPVKTVNDLLKPAHQSR